MLNYMNDDFMAKRLGALAHPVRLALVRALVRAGPAGLPAGKLGAPLGIAPNALTFHLQKLAHVGLVSSHREGQFVIYSAAFIELLDLADNLVGACCADTPEKCGPRCPSDDGAAAFSTTRSSLGKGVQNE